MTTRVILPFHGLVMEHAEILRVSPFGGIDVPYSLDDFRSRIKKWKDENLKDWLKDGWNIKILKANADAIQKMYGLPIAPITSGMLERAKVAADPSPLYVVTQYTTVDTSDYTLVAGYSLLQATCVGGGGGAGTKSGGAGGGGGGGGCAYVMQTISPTATGTLSVVRGAKGTGGVSGNTDGVAGDDSSITGSPLTAVLLGGGGGAGHGASNVLGGTGGTYSGGTIGGNGGAGGLGSNSLTGGAGGGGAGGPTGVGGAGAASGGTSGNAGTGTGGGGGSAPSISSGAAGGGGTNKNGGFAGSNGADRQYPGGAAGSGSFFCPPGAVGQSLYVDDPANLNAAQGRNGGMGGGGGGSSSGNQSNPGGIGTAAIMVSG